MRWNWMAGGLAALAVAAAALPAAGQQDVDLNNLPPWPAGRHPPEGMPSRLDTAPVAEVVAAADAQILEGEIVLRRRMEDDPAVMAWASEQAAKGDARAMVLLGDIKTYAQKVRYPPAEAFAHYKAAADLGEARGMVNAAHHYALGRGVTKNGAEAMRLLTLAAEKGDWLAYFALSKAYQDGEIVPQDLEAADRWAAMREAAGPRRREEPVNPPVPVRADQPRLEAAARAGDVPAMRALGFSHSVGIFEGEAAAARWYQMAIDKNDIESMTDLGWLHEWGTGVRKDPATAVAWYVKAAQAGDRQAMFHLARMYGAGEGVAADKPTATRWLYRWFWAPDLPTMTPDTDQR